MLESLNENVVVHAVEGGDQDQHDFTAIDSDNTRSSGVAGMSTPIRRL